MGYGRLSREYREYLQSPQWQRIKGLVWERDGGRCQHCGGWGHDVHHLTYDHFRCERLHELVLLCRPCHRLADDARREARDIDANHYFPTRQPGDDADADVKVEFLPDPPVVDDDDFLQQLKRRIAI